MPAAAVIPAPIAYIKVVAVKKLVVGSRRVEVGSLFGVTDRRWESFRCATRVFWRRVRGALNRVSRTTVRFTLKKLECSKQA